MYDFARQEVNSSDLIDESEDDQISEALSWSSSGSGEEDEDEEESRSLERAARRFVKRSPNPARVLPRRGAGGGGTSKTGAGGGGGSGVEDDNVRRKRSKG